MNRVIIQRNPDDLTLHAMQEYIPAPEEGPKWISFCDSVRGRGVLQPLLITADGRIMDGGWRWRAAKAVSLASVPCIVRSEEEARELITGTLMHRKPCGVGGSVYIALGLFDLATLNGKAKRAKNLKNANVSRNPIGSDFGKTARVLCDEWGISEDTLRQAVEVREAFEANHDFKLRWEQDLVNGRIGLGAILKGIGGVETSRPGQEPYGKTTEQQLELFDRFFRHDIGHRFTAWPKFSSHDKAKALLVVSQSFQEAPIDLLEGIKKSAEAAIRLRKEAGK